MIPRPGGLSETLSGQGDVAARIPRRRPRADLVLRPSTGLFPVRGGGALPPALRRAEVILARQDKTFGSRPVRVPMDAFVPIASRLLPPPAGKPALMLEGPGATANDNASPAAAPAPARSLVRELIFLAIFAATLAGTYYIGRLAATATVIVVPGPSSDQSRVT